jgi:hypothetical protein
MIAFPPKGFYDGIRFEWPRRGTMDNQQTSGGTKKVGKVFPSWLLYLAFALMALAVIFAFLAAFLFEQDWTGVIFAFVAPFFGISALVLIIIVNHHRPAHGAYKGFAIAGIPLGILSLIFSSEEAVVLGTLLLAILASDNFTFTKEDFIKQGQSSETFYSVSLLKDKTKGTYSELVVVDNEKAFLSQFEATPMTLLGKKQAPAAASLPAYTIDYCCAYGSHCCLEYRSPYYFAIDYYSGGGWAGDASYLLYEASPEDAAKLVAFEKEKVTEAGVSFPEEAASLDLKL